MTADEIRQLKLLILSTVAYYGHSIQDDVLALYVEDLADLPFDQVLTAIKEVRRDPKTTRFPLPAIIRDRITPADTSEADAREAANRIIQAIANCGWNNPDRARALIGELGWRVVQLEGGWMNVCQTLTHENVGQLKAQWRDMALATIKRANAGTLSEAPSIPHKRSDAKQLSSMQDIIKQIPDQHMTGGKDKP